MTPKDEAMWRDIDGSRGGGPVSWIVVVATIVFCGTALWAMVYG